jgi:low temperature requirement protein LtrA
VSQRDQAAAWPEDRPVSTLELFTDLVFVFAITQLTALLSANPSPLGVLQTALIFATLWWMFGGYVFLTNAMPLDRKGRRLLLLVAMCGFLMMGLAIPTTFQGGGVVFGIGFAVVIVVHTGLFTFASGAPLRDVARFAPLNLVGAALIIAAGILQGTVAYLLFGLSFLLQILISIVSSRITFDLRAGHFVERYGLLLLIVLGESIVAIGVGAGGLALDAPLIGAAILSLGITSVFWWLYFSGDDARAEEALATATGPAKIRVALMAFFYSSIPMVLGIVAFAAGVKTAIAHPLDPMPVAPAMALTIGAALFLLGDALFRFTIGVRHSVQRSLAAVAVLLAAVVGQATSALAALATMLAVLLAVIVLEQIEQG